MNENGSSEDPGSNSHLYSLSGKEFRAEMLRIFKELKGSMEQTASKTEDDMSVEMKKTPNKNAKDWKTWSVKWKISLEGFTRRITADENRMSELKGELHINSIQQEKMEKS